MNDSHAGGSWLVRLLCVIALLGLTLACGAPAEQDQPTDRRYPLRGRVMAMDVEGGSLRIAHEEIPGYMDAMTMRFPVLDREALGRVKKGDQVKGTLVVAPDNRYWLEGLEVIAEPLPPPIDEES